MKNILLSLFLLFTVSAAHAEGMKDTALGITVGSPLGFTGRTWVNSDNSFAYGAGWSITDTDKFEVYTDYLWNAPEVFDINGRMVDFFYGGGLVLRTNSGKYENQAVFGVRAPLGLSMEFTNPNAELFTEFALNAAFIPSTAVFMDLLVGVRFHIF